MFIGAVRAVRVQLAFVVLAALLAGCANRNDMDDLAESPPQGGEPAPHEPPAEPPAAAPPPGEPRDRAEAPPDTVYAAESPSPSPDPAPSEADDEPVPTAPPTAVPPSGAVPPIIAAPSPGTAAPTGGAPAPDTLALPNESPPPPTAPDEDPLFAIDRELMSRLGGMAWNPADSMRVGVPQTVELLISPSHSGDSLAVVISGGGERRVLSRDLRITEVMRASLRGSGFEIDPAEARDQPVSGVEPTLWSWLVTPEERGLRRLALRIEALYLDGEQERWRTLYDTSEVVEVWVVEPPAQPILSVLSRFLAFAESHPEFVYGTLLLPLGLFVRRRWNGRKDRADS